MLLARTVLVHLLKCTLDLLITFELSVYVPTLLDAALPAEQNHLNAYLSFMTLKSINLLTLGKYASTALAGLALAFLTGCASPITAKVTSFNQWPSDTAGATFSFIRPVDALNDLEQRAYESKVQTELQKLGLKPAPAGQVGRIQVDVITGNGTRDKQFREAIYQDNYIYNPPYRDAAGNVFGGFWVPDQFGSRYVGDRIVTRTVQVSNLRLRLLDAQGNAPGKPRAVFESRAVYEGSIEDLATLVPFLVRAIFDDFPGQNAKVRIVRFDSKTGAVVEH